MMVAWMWWYPEWRAVDACRTCRCNAQNTTVEGCGTEEKHWREGSERLEPRTLHIPTHTLLPGSHCSQPNTKQLMGEAVSSDRLEVGTVGEDPLGSPWPHL